jgi:cation diffusion facilitator family transporter
MATPSDASGESSPLRSASPALSTPPPDAPLSSLTNGNGKVGAHPTEDTPPSRRKRQASAVLAQKVASKPTVILTKEMQLDTGLSGGASHTQHALQAVLVAMVFNFLIAASKLGVAIWVTRSAALFSEGLHSAADAFNSMTLLFGIIQGKKPPDRTHPYGYGLETNFWALIASVVLFGSSILALWMGWQRLSHPEPLHDVGWAIALLALSAVFEVGAVAAAAKAVVYEVGLAQSNLKGWSLFATAWQNIGRVQSPTTRFVFFEDIVALLGALIAGGALLLGVIAVNLQWLPQHYASVPDAVASLVIGVMLLGLSFNLFAYNRNFLTGAAASEGTEIDIERLVLETNGITRMVELRTIDQGVSGLFIHLKVEVEPDLPVREVDDRIEHLKDRLQQHVGNIKEVLVEVIANEVDQVWGEAFKALVQEGVDVDLLQPREALILHNVLAFTESTAREIMIPRKDVVAVDADATLAEVATLAIETRHSKLPVFDADKRDELVGMLHARDVFEQLLQGQTDQPISGLLRDITIYPENKRVSDLLEEFKRHKLQLAAVLDEHGGFSGIITTSDLMEELVGELWDEDDEVEESLELERLSTTELRMSGRISTYDVNEQFGLTIPDDEFTTVGGFVFGLLGRQPEEGDEVTYEDYQFTVEAMDGARVKLVKLTLLLGELSGE